MSQNFDSPIERDFCGSVPAEEKGQMGRDTLCLICYKPFTEPSGSVECRSAHAALASTVESGETAKGQPASIFCGVQGCTLPICIRCGFCQRVHNKKGIGISHATNTVFCEGFAECDCYKHFQQVCDRCQCAPSRDADHAPSGDDICYGCKKRRSEHIDGRACWNNSASATFYMKLDAPSPSPVEEVGDAQVDNISSMCRPDTTDIDRGNGNYVDGYYAEDANKYFDYLESRNAKLRVEVDKLKELRGLDADAYVALTVVLRKHVFDTVKSEERLFSDLGLNTSEGRHFNERAEKAEHELEILKANLPQPVTGPAGDKSENPAMQHEFRMASSEFDEVCVKDAFVHVERMDETAWWIGIDSPGKTSLMINTGLQDGIWFFNVEEDGGECQSFQVQRKIVAPSSQPTASPAEIPESDICRDPYCWGDYCGKKYAGSMQPTASPAVAPTAEEETKPCES